MLSPLRHPRSSLPLAYGLSLGAVLCVLLIKLRFHAQIGQDVPFLLLFAPPMIGAWYGGVVAGLVSVAAAALGAAYLFLPPALTLSIATPAHLVRLGLFMGEGVAIVLVTAKMRQARSLAQAQAALAHEARQQLDAILQGVDVGITLQASAGALIYANQAAARLAGFPSSEALVTTPVEQILRRFEVLDEDGAPLPADQFPGRQALAGVQSERTVRFRVLESGEERWSLVKGIPIRDGAGPARFALNVFEDITERKLAEDALRVSREWLATTLRSIGDGVVTTDAAGRVTFLNPVAEQLIGWPAEAAQGRPLADLFLLINEGSRRPVESPVNRVLREGLIVGLANDTVLIRRDRTEVAIDDCAAPIRDPAGRLVGVVLVFRDVTEQRREKERQRYISQSIAELSSSLDYEVTLAAVARLAVPHFADWCAVDMLLDDGEIRRLAVAHVDPSKVAWAHELARRYPMQKDAPNGVPHVLRTGQTEWMAEIPDALLVAIALDEEQLRIARELGLRSYIVAPMIARGRALGALTFVAAESGRRYDERDVHLAERVAERAAVALDNALLFQEAKAAQAAAEAAAALRERLIGIVSHDLRNPLSAISMGAAALQRSGRGAAEERAIERIAKSAGRMREMIEQLLDLTRANTGSGIPINPRVTRLDALCLGLIEELMASHPRTRIVYDGPDEVTGCWDEGRLGEVVSNLLGNAVEHGDGSTITVTLRTTEDEAVLRVHNRGEPISAEVLSRIFEPFRQGQGEGKRRGLGLGLYIAREIVLAHGGDLTAASSPAEGTAFTVRLPRRAPSST